MRTIFYFADQNPHRDSTLGITSYSLSLWKALEQFGGIERQRAIVSPSSASPVREAEAAPGQLIKIKYATDSLPGRVRVDFTHQSSIDPEPGEILHYPKGYLPRRLLKKTPTVGTVHDTILQHYADHYPQTRSRLNYEYWLYVTRKSLENFDAIITVSEVSKRQIQAFAERYRLRVPEIHISYQTPRWGAELAGDNRKEQVIHLGSGMPHKRTAWLIDTWILLRKKGVLLPKLVVAGNVSAELPRDESLTYLGYLSDEQLRQEIARSQALIFPSEIEGFGLPAMESWLLGTPAIFRADTSMSEVIPAPFHLNFTESEPQSLVKAVERASEFSAEDRETVASDLAAKLSLRQMAESTVSVYKQLA